MSNEKAEAMRARLATVGIFLEPDRKPPTASQPAAVHVQVVDRDAVRAILVAAGAPEADLDWLTASCPSLTAAKTYRPPRGTNG